METLRSARLGGMGAAEGHRGGKGDIHADLHDAGTEFRDGVGEGRVVLLEAMSMGKVVVTTQLPGAVEDVRDGETAR